MFSTLTLPRTAFYGLTSELLDFTSVLGSTPGNLVHHLAYYGSALGRYPHVAWRGAIYPNFNTVLVGESGCGKGESLRIISACYDFPNHRELLAPSKNTTLTSGPRFLRMLSEAIQVGEDGDNRFLLVDEECSTQIKAASVWSAFLAETLCKVSDGVAISESTRGRDISLPPLHYTSIGHITPMALTQNMRREAFFNGYANRILWMGIPAQEFSNADGTYDEHGLQELRKKLIESLQGSGERENIEMSVEARSRYLEYVTAHRDRMAINARFRALTKRSPQMCLKIALILALVDQEERITSRNIDGAIAVMGYCEQSLWELFMRENGGESPESIVRNYLAQHGEVYRTNLMRDLMPRLRREDLDATLSALVEHGAVRQSQRRISRGRTPQVYSLTPSQG